MKLSLTLLKSLIDLSGYDTQRLRHLFDDLGLEIEQVVEESGEVFFKIETLANRGDHLSALGIARELSARLRRPIQSLEVYPTWPPVPYSPAVSVQTTSCLRYALLEMAIPLTCVLPESLRRVMTDCKNQIPPIVHFLNYVLEEIGQPMHAFDADLIEGKIRVVMSRKEEEVVALDGKSYRVPSGSILVQDAVKTVAVAGVIGCANSMVSAGTTRVLIESAAFDPVAIRKTARAMGLSTAASYVFERGSDREQVVGALRRLLALIPDVDPACLGFAYIPGDEGYRKSLSIDVNMLKAYLNIPQLDRHEIRQRLEPLGYDVVFQNDHEIAVVSPSWRERSVMSPMAVVEDFARVYGFNALPLQLPPLQYEPVPEHQYELLMKRIEASLIGQGFCEVITKSYYSHEVVAALEEVDPGIRGRHVSVKNSVEKDYSFLKSTNCIHLARLVEGNLRRDVGSIKVFECGRLYDRTEQDRPYRFERDVLTLAVSGRWYDGEWKKPETIEENLSFLKGVLESLIRAAGGTMAVGPSTSPYLHPHVQAAVVVDGGLCGFFGLLHPTLRERLGLDQAMLYVELDMASIGQLCKKGATAGRFSEYPAITRDVTLKVPRGTTAGTIVEAIESFGNSLLRQIHIVDSFQKKDESFCRITYRLHFQSDERTLEREEIDQEMAEIVGRVAFKRA